MQIPSYISITLDLQLTFRAHVLGMKVSVDRRIIVLKAMSGIRWGAYPITLLTVYRGFGLVWTGDVSSWWTLNPLSLRSSIDFSTPTQSEIIRRNDVLTLKT